MKVSRQKAKGAPSKITGWRGGTEAETPIASSLTLYLNYLKSEHTNLHLCPDSPLFIRLLLSLHVQS